MLESLNGSVRAALQADSHGIQIHGTPAPPYIFNQCRPGRGARATKSNVFIGRAFVIWTFDGKYPDDLTAPYWYFIQNTHLKHNPHQLNQYQLKVYAR